MGICEMEFLNKIKDNWIANWKYNVGAIAVGAAIGGLLFDSFFGWTIMVTIGTFIIEVFVALSEDGDDSVN